MTAPKQRTLLAALLVARNHPVSAGRLVNELWPEQAPSTATAALQVYVSGLRKVIGDRVRTTPAGYVLDIATDDVDAHRFEDMLGGPARSAATLAQALDLWHGPPFDGVVTGPDIAAAAVRLNELRRSARQELAGLALADGRHAEILADLAGWVAEQPTAEGLVGHLMLALHRAGRSAEAMAAFATLRDVLAERFDTVPGDEVTRLAEAIRRRDPTLAQPLKLPAARTRFIGRRSELDRCAALLGDSRLLTIVGPGGSGKTRLSYELARELAADHPDGIQVVELAGYPTASAGDVEALAARVAASVGGRELPGETVAASLARHLGARRVLLVLDNCEHVRAAVAAVVHELLAACPAVRVLATSREPLGLPSEDVFVLGGLSLPDTDAPRSRSVGSDAVRLFGDRAAAARGGRRLQPDEEPYAVELCRRLGGLPLALELAAPRLRTLSLRELVARLDRGLDLLSGSSPVDRHQTMRTAIDWGHDLLEPEQQVLFRRLSVFAGGFDLAAAEQVGADPAGPPPRSPDEVLDVLSRLVERSMVDRLDAAGGGSRYRLLETTREYAAERLATDGAATEEREAGVRHSRVYQELVAAAPPTDGPAHAQWLASISAEHDNIRAALERSLSGGDPETGLAIATSMWWYWWVTGQMLDGRTWLRRALKATEYEVSQRRGQALRAAASLARNSGDLAEARRLGTQALDTFRELDNRAGIISSLNNLSITAQGQHDYEASLEYGYEGLRLAEDSGNDRAVAAALNNTAGTLRCLDRLDEAGDMFARALAGFEKIADRRGEAAARFNLATVDRRMGRLDDARQRYLHALAIYTELDIAEGQLDAIEGLAHLHALQGRPAEALRLLVVSDRERSRLGAPLFTPDELADRNRAEKLARAALSREEMTAALRAASTSTLADLVASYRIPA
ncbi:BTAD domain-containing putative transcriptional regulator [Rugosimonospora africana]|uniref:BTAD domain-containing putative transcriptional regulator n=1 Tax=Rugosimonospora africana TaxID=556532 RepID=UPI001943E692|nr:BTAD domain-containing putative transcriptional regulator [Rugosimonospora africana]